MPDEMLDETERSFKLVRVPSEHPIREVSHDPCRVEVTEPAARAFGVGVLLHDLGPLGTERRDCGEDQIRNLGCGDRARSRLHVPFVRRGLVDADDLVMFVDRGIQSISESVSRHDSMVAGPWSVTARTADAMLDAAAR